MTELDRPGRFVQSLAALAAEEDRAALAALRRGLGKPPGSVAEMHRYVVPFLLQPRPWDDDAYYLVASLFGLHPRHEAGTPERRGDVGAVLNRFAQENGPAQKGKRDSTERRFMALLNAERDGLGNHLRHVVALLKTQDLALDYVGLLRDIRDWELADRRVQKRWARSYWAAEMPAISNVAEESGTTVA